VPILAIDSATTYVTAAVVEDGRVLADHLASGDGAAARRVLAEVDAVLAAAGVGVDALEGIAVGVGPGSFTGLRIGIATAVALGDAARVPVAGVSTLAAIAHGAGEGAVAAIDARRGEVFAMGGDIAPGAYAPGELAADLTPGTLVVGDGALRYRSVFEAAGHRVPPDDDGVHAPHGAGHAALARFDGEPVRPLYFREPDAREPGQ
jgi:tRNA threonylcarbamoyladenosine biosynthesis protein TsaB